MFTLHIGPHKTGSSFIQRRMTQNRSLFDDSYQTVVHGDVPLRAMLDAIYPIRSLEQARATVKTIQIRARLLGEIYSGAQNVLVSSEDMLGPLPSRVGIKGLYPFSHITLPAIVAGLQQAGATVQLVFYTRDYGDWLRSVYRYKFRENSDRAFAPRRFRQRHDLPKDWQECLERLKKSVPDTPFHQLSFEQDRATGNFGTALFDLSGLPRATQDRFKPLAPVNVSQAATVDPRHWQSGK